MVQGKMSNKYESQFIDAIVYPPSHFNLNMTKTIIFILNMILTDTETSLNLKKI